MGNIVESNNWVGNIQQLETTDVVIGGDPQSGGTANIQAQQLATRTQYLKDRIDTFLDVYEVSTTANIPHSEIAHKLLMVAPASNSVEISILISNAGVVIPIGRRIPICIKDSIGLGIKKAVEIKFLNVLTACTILGQNSLSSNSLFLYEGETATLVYLGSNTFQILDSNVEFADIGDVRQKANITMNGFVMPAGQIVSRRDFPRLWKLAQGVAITDATWVSSVENSGKYSSGNGTTTFRLPDLRGVFIRGFDAGRGFDTIRGIDQGIYVSDLAKAHNHKIASLRGTVKIEDPNNIPAVERGVVPLLSIPTANNYYSNVITNTDNNSPAATETAPKSVAYINYIKY